LCLSSVAFSAIPIVPGLFRVEDTVMMTNTNLDRLRQLVTFTFTAEQEDQAPEEHFDNAELAAEIRKAINEEARYSYGPIPDWFCSKVVASYGDFESDPQYLGCCSYETFEDYTSEKGGYYVDQCEQALGNLASKIDATRDLIKALDRKPDITDVLVCQDCHSVMTKNDFPTAADRAEELKLVFQRYTDQVVEFKSQESEPLTDSCFTDGVECDCCGSTPDGPRFFAYYTEYPK